MKKVSLKTIAERMGVSAVTVHKALKNQSGVSAAMREKILACAAELGYTARPSLGELHFAHVVNKYFLVSADEQYYTAIYYHLDHECEKAGARLHMVLHDTVERTVANLRDLAADRLDGIFVSGQVEPALLDEIAKFNVPVVCIDFYSSEYSFSYVYADYYYACYTLTKFLIKRGHKKICFVGDVKFSNAIADRYFGYLRALNRFNVGAPQMLICRNIEKGYEERDFELEPFPTAFICHSDRAARALYGFLAKKGLRIPDDVSVISFDNTEICHTLTPGLTSMGIDKSAYAVQAFRLMRQALQQRLDTLHYIKLNLQICERESVRDLNG